MAVERKIVILLVEDSPTIRTFYKNIFIKAGFEVIEAGNGREAFAAISKRIPDIIVLDLVLPDYHGLEILKKIRAHSLLKKIPVLVLTSLKDMKDVQKAITMGANYYSVKGSDPPEKLLGMIYKLLKKTKQASTKEKEVKSEKVQKDEEDTTDQIGEDDIEFIRD